MNFLLLFSLLAFHPSQISGAYYHVYIRYYSHCTFTGYVPGGNKVIVKKIEAPVAKMEKGLFTGLAGNMAKASSGAQHTTMLLKGFGKLANIAPKLGPALGLFGVAFSAVKGFTDPSPQDILDQANKAIKELTNEVNDRLEEMKGYVSEKTINLEKDLIGRKYKSLFLMWGNCLKETTKAKVDECQEDAAKDIINARPEFAIFADSVYANRMLSVDDTKRLEATLLSYRDYVVLCLASLSALTATLADQPNKELDYVRFAKDLNDQIAWSSTYVTNAVSIIKRMHTEGDHCKDTLKCVKKKEIWEGGWIKAHTANEYTCSCVFDRGDVSTRVCTVLATTRHDGKRPGGIYKNIWAPSENEETGSKWIADEYLERRERKKETYLQQLGESITNYWEGEVLDVVPSWKSLKITLPSDDSGMESARKFDAEFDDRMNTRSDDYMRRREQVINQMAIEMDENENDRLDYNRMPYRGLHERYQDNGREFADIPGRFLPSAYRDNKRFDTNRHQYEKELPADEFYYERL